MHRYCVEIVDDLLCLIDATGCEVDVAEIVNYSQAARQVDVWRKVYGGVVNAAYSLSEIVEYLEACA